MRPDGSELTYLTESTARGDSSVDPRWSPDGASLMYDHKSGGKWSIWIADIATGETRQITDASPDFYGYNWTGR
jgi:Tol biopolymer transport system component